MGQAACLTPRVAEPGKVERDMARRGKKYRAAREKIDSTRRYSLEEAVELVLQTHYAGFDESVDVAVRLGVDPRHADQMVRGAVVLPHGLGKQVKVVVFAKGEKEREAQEAGADYVGAEDLAEKIQKEGWLEFDAALATPAMMKKVSAVARILGPRGLMPNPKAGTVVPPDDLPRAINELKAGRVEFRNDKTGNLHIPIGKASFDTQRLLENAQAVIDAVSKQRPSAVKGQYIRRIFVTSTMGPGIRLESGGSLN